MNSGDSGIFCIMFVVFNRISIHLAMFWGFSRNSENPTNTPKKIHQIFTNNFVKSSLIFFENRNETYPQLTDHYFTGEYPVKLVDELGDNKITQLSLLSTGSNN